MSEKQEAVCFGTKERDPCGCGGDKSKCTYYEDVKVNANDKHELYQVELSKEEVESLMKCAIRGRLNWVHNLNIQANVQSALDKLSKLA